MPNKSYEQGRRDEYYVMDKLKDKGYLCVRSAGSHGPADIIAGKNGKVLLVQVKSSKKGKSSEYLAPMPIRELTQWARHFKARPMLAYQDEDQRWHMRNLSKGFIYKYMEGV